MVSLLPFHKPISQTDVRPNDTPAPTTCKRPSFSSVKVLELLLSSNRRTCSPRSLLIFQPTNLAKTSPEYLSRPISLRPSRVYTRARCVGVGPPPRAPHGKADFRTAKRSL